MILDEITSIRSGSIGNVVHSRNPHGPYTRARTTPANPQTSRQTRVRRALETASDLWRDTLTAAQRRSWDDYAGRVTLLDRLGNHRHLDGRQMFIRCNSGRTRVFMGVVLDAPAGSSLGTFTQPAYNDLAGAGFISVSFDVNQPWVGEDNSWLIIYVSDEHTTNTNFFAGPYRFAGAIRGNSVAPPTSPANIGDPWLPQTFGRRWGRARVAFEDGRLSGPVQTRFFEL